MKTSHDNLEMPAQQTETKLKLKLATYFLIGLITSFLGLIVAGLWLRYKTKTNTKKKLKFLIAGFIFSLVIQFIINTNLVTPLFKNILFSQFPELKIVDQSLERSYPGFNTGYSILYTNNGKSTTKSLTVKMTSGWIPPISDIKRSGQVVCRALSVAEKEYDTVNVIFTQSSKILWIIPLNKRVSLGGGCDSFWFSDQINHLPIPSLSPIFQN